MSSWGFLKKAAYIILPLLVYFLVHDAAEILLFAALNQFMLVCGQKTTDFLSANSYTVQGIINGLALLLGIAAIWQAARREIRGKERTKVPHTGEQSEEAKRKSEKKKTLISYLMLTALAFFSALGLNLLFDLLGITQSSQAFENTAKAQFGVSFLVGLILYGMLSPVAEEAVFRGLVYNRMKRCFNLPVALVASALLFGCYHGNVVQALYGSILGFLIACVYERYDCFAAPVLYHGVANVSIFVLTYHDGLGHLEKGTSIMMTGISFVAAGICLWSIMTQKKE